MKPLYYVLPLCAVVVCLIYLFQGAEGNLTFIQLFRVPTLLGLITVSIAIGVSTILFQTLTGNKILTPSLVGFDALYILIQTSIVFFLSTTDYLNLPATGKFIAESLAMILLATSLFSLMFTRLQSDLTRLILTGVIIGVLFRSLSGFMARVMSPNDYAVVQIGSFASLNNIDVDLLPLAMAIIAACLLMILTLAPKLDVIALGRDISISLGIPYDRSAFQIMMLIATLVAVSTALVGPMVFLGLIVSSLTYRLVSTHQHRVLIPVTACVSVLVIVCGQLIFERLLGLNGTISIIIELVGGLLFLYLLLRRQS